MMPMPGMQTMFPGGISFKISHQNFDVTNFLGHRLIVLIYLLFEMSHMIHRGFKKLNIKQLLL